MDFINIIYEKLSMPCFNNINYNDGNFKNTSVDSLEDNIHVCYPSNQNNSLIHKEFELKHP